MRVAIVHYWLVSMRGGEKVLEALCELFPHADIFTHVYQEAGVSDIIKAHRIRTTFIQQLPCSHRLYQKYLALMPLALERLDLSQYELVISIESGPAKGVIVSPEAVHVCYCCSPMRYLWDLRHEYLKSTSWTVRAIVELLFHYLRVWDVTSAARVDHFIAISQFVAARIARYYHRSADIISPPVDTGAFTSDGVPRDDFYLMVGQLVRYKRVDLAVDAFSKLGRKLVVIGEGAEREALERQAGDNITFLGWQPFETVRDHMRRCRALVFPGLEDFGIVPVEAAASGSPVIAYKGGGALETVADGETGLFFEEQTTKSLMEAVERFEALSEGFDSERMVAHARRFDHERFKREMSETLDRLTRNRHGFGERSLR
jgi:glycosyltransferase involved in cell wall biosynthesis